jgi:hypothetical protein
MQEVVPMMARAASGLLNTSRQVDADGISPWPFVVLGEVGGLGFGVAMLALASPRRSRP